MNWGKGLMILGGLIFLMGLTYHYRAQLPFLNRLGHLPGDIAIEKENFKFYFPITTSILLSLVLSALLWLLNK